MNNIEYVENKLKKYGAEIYEYRGVKFIGIKNPYSDNNMAITFGNEENVMEFTYQTARFTASDLDGLIAHAERFLKNELDRKSTRLNSSHTDSSRMPSSA